MTCAVHKHVSPNALQCAPMRGARERCALAYHRGVSRHALPGVEPVEKDHGGGDGDVTVFEQQAPKRAHEHQRRQPPLLLMRKRQAVAPGRAVLQHGHGRDPPLRVGPTAPLQPVHADVGYTSAGRHRVGAGATSRHTH